MTNKAIEALTDGSVSEDLWISLHHNNVYSELIDELNNARLGEGSSLLNH